MRSTVFTGFLLLAAVGAAPALADAIGEPVQRPGPMEYLEVIGILDVTGAARERARKVREQQQRLTQLHRSEQLQLLRETQRKPLERLREKLSDEERVRRAEEEAVRAEERREQQEAS